MNKIKISSKKLSNIIKECIKQHINESEEWTSIKEWGFPEGMDDGDNVTYDWTDFYPNTKEGEKEYSWDEYDYNNNITPLRKDFQHRQMDSMAKGRDINKYWTDKEVDRGQRIMNRWVNGRRDTESLEDAYFAPRNEAKEYINKIVKEALNEISYDTAADAYYKSYDRLIDRFKKRQKETPKQARQRNNLYNHMNDRVKERIDPNMPVVIVGGDKQGKYTTQDILNDFEITGYKDAPQNGIFKDSKIVGYPIIKGYLGPMWDGDKIRYESPEAYKFFSEAKKQVGKLIKEALSDYYDGHQSDNDRDPQYDAYVLVDDSDGAIVSNYEVQHNPNAKEDAIKDAQDEAARNKYGSYTVYGCIGNEYDEDTIVYKTFEESKKANDKKVNEGVNNNNYTHFAILKPINKIVNGWDYNGYDSDELRRFKNDYFLVDIKDYGFNPKDIKILTKQGCLKQGINPDDDSMWDNGSDYIQ